ncbi:MAG: hypothetical protein RIQ79_2686 [Verrucomicrobiota bacterium]
MKIILPGGTGQIVHILLRAFTRVGPGAARELVARWRDQV